MAKLFFSDSKSCPTCKCRHLLRIRRSWWTRLIPWAKNYSCVKCFSQFMVINKFGRCLFWLLACGDIEYLTMKNRKNFIEKRKRDRFKVRGGAFTSIKSEYDDKTGPIQDISIDGFATRYIGKKGQIYGLLEVDIFYSGSGLYVQKVKSKTISDFKIDKKAPGSFLAIRQCCVQFCELADDQSSLLENFIQKYVDRRSGKDRRQPFDSGSSDYEGRSEVERRVNPLLS